MKEKRSGEEEENEREEVINLLSISRFNLFLENKQRLLDFSLHFHEYHYTLHKYNAPPFMSFIIRSCTSFSSKYMDEREFSKAKRGQN